MDDRKLRQIKLQDKKRLTEEKNRLKIWNEDTKLQEIK